jgi:predicted ATP-grasp superfamily ATP-dependent carboligase
MSLIPAPRLLIVGGSVRAAAASAVRAGLSPLCVDRFGDEDLRRLAKIVAVQDDLRKTIPALEALPPTPWMFTGPLENNRRLIAAISRKHPLLGNHTNVLRRVRDPFWVEATLRTAGLPTLEHRPMANPPSLDGRWLLKPRYGGGGCGIAPWIGQALPRHTPCYFQERRHGVDLAALFVAGPKRVELVGICEQLIGTSAQAPQEFGYAGSIGPVRMTERVRDQLQQIGVVLANGAGLRGLFGVDFILEDGVPWLVEVNPRYTASVEVVERATGRTLMAEHVATCSSNFAGPLETSSCQRRSHLLVGKQIVFAPHDLTIPCDTPPWNSLDALDDNPWLADIPAPGSRITRGWPICTVFAEAESVEQCRAELSAHRDAILAATLRS